MNGYQQYLKKINLVIITSVVFQIVVTLIFSIVFPWGLALVMFLLTIACFINVVLYYIFKGVEELSELYQFNFLNVNIKAYVSIQLNTLIIGMLLVPLYIIIEIIGLTVMDIYNNWIYYYIANVIIIYIGVRYYYLAIQNIIAKSDGDYLRNANEARKKFLFKSGVLSRRIQMLLVIFTLIILCIQTIFLFSYSWFIIYIAIGIAMLIIGLLLPLLFSWDLPKNHSPINPLKKIAIILMENKVSVLTFIITLIMSGFLNQVVRQTLENVEEMSAFFDVPQEYLILDEYDQFQQLAEPLKGELYEISSDYSIFDAYQSYKLFDNQVDAYSDDYNAKIDATIQDNEAVLTDYNKSIDQSIGKLNELKDTASGFEDITIECDTFWCIETSLKVELLDEIDNAIDDAEEKKVDEYNLEDVKISRTDGFSAVEAAMDDFDKARENLDDIAISVQEMTSEVNNYGQEDA